MNCECTHYRTLKELGLIKSRILLVIMMLLYVNIANTSPEMPKFANFDNTARIYSIQNVVFD